MASKPRKPSALDALTQAAQQYAKAVGAAEHTNGYRVGNPKREAELYQKEMQQWARASNALADFQRVARRVIRDAKEAARYGK